MLNLSILYKLISNINMHYELTVVDLEFIDSQISVRKQKQ